jgi:hypothetical protein
MNGHLLTLLGSGWAIGALLGYMMAVRNFEILHDAFEGRLNRTQFSAVSRAGRNMQQQQLHTATCMGMGST